MNWIVITSTSFYPPMWLHNGSCLCKLCKIRTNTNSELTFSCGKETEDDVCGCVFLKDDLENGEEVATCPSCSLIVRVIYDKVRNPNSLHLNLLFFVFPIWSDGVCSDFQEAFSCGELVEAPPFAPERKLEALQSWNLFFFCGFMGEKFIPQTLKFHKSRGDILTDRVCKYVSQDVLFPIV